MDGRDGAGLAVAFVTTALTAGGSVGGNPSPSPGPSPSPDPNLALTQTRTLTLNLTLTLTLTLRHAATRADSSAVMTSSLAS